MGRCLSPGRVVIIHLIVNRIYIIPCMRGAG